MSELGTYVRVFLCGDYYDVVEADADSLDANVAAWLHSGRTRDCLLHLTLIHGDSVCVRASDVEGWIVSTPAGREKAAAVEKAQECESKALRHAEGWSDE